MASLLTRLKNKKPSENQISPGSIELKGTGLTKRIAERTERAYAKEADKALSQEGSLIKSDAEIKFERAISETLDTLRAEHQKGKLIFDESQIKAIAGIVHNQCSVLIGAAGTGKTTIENVIIEELAKRVNVIDLRKAKFVAAKTPDGQTIRVRADQTDTKEENKMPAIACCAYTGRATQQMKRSLPNIWHSSTSTIHAMLGYAPVFEDVPYFDPITREDGFKQRRIFRPSFGRECKLPYKIIIMDEASMTPIPLWNEIIDAVHPNTRFLLIGDINQLPPVYGKSVLGYAMRKWPVFELTTIHRQAAGNAIIANAHRCLNGKPLENAVNFHMIGDGVNNVKPAPSGASEMALYVLQVVKALHAKGLYDPYRDAIITPWNKGLIGTDALNTHFVQMFNPEREENGVKVNKRIKIHTGTDHKFFAVGDKVMITSNINSVDPPITNGMIGFVDGININGNYDMKRAQTEFGEDDVDIDAPPIELDMDNFSLTNELEEAEKKDGKEEETRDQRQSSHVMLIKFENGQEYSCSTAGDYRRVEMGYCITCHKAQGGEYPNAIIICHSANAKSLSREWLYTAITRARNNVYIICNSRGLRAALSTQKIKGATIAEKIKSYVIETKSDDDMDVMDREKHPVLWENKTLA